MEKDELKEYFKKQKEKYQKANPCPNCGSHNVDFDLNWINGADSSWSEWCNDCGWERENQGS